MPTSELRFCREEELPRRADQQYYSTIDSNGFAETDPNGTWQSLLLGAPRQFFLSAKAKF